MGVSTDPDDVSLERAARLVGQELHGLGVKSLTPSQVKTITRCAVYGWIMHRAKEWSSQRGISGVGSPDAYTVGFAETVLPLLAEATNDLPLKAPIFEWSKQDMAKFCAHAFQLIEEQRAQTLSDPDPQVWEMPI